MPRRSISYIFVLCLVTLGGCSSSHVQKYFIDPANKAGCAECATMTMETATDYDPEAAFCVMAEDTLIAVAQVKEKANGDDHAVMMLIIPGISVDVNNPVERRQKRWLDDYSADRDTKFSVHYWGGSRGAKDSVVILGYQFSFSEKRVKPVAKTWYCSAVKQAVVDEVQFLTSELRKIGPLRRLNSEEQERTVRSRRY
jgi:hypothetical protein